MARKVRPMRYPVNRGFKMKEDTFRDLMIISRKKNMKYSTLVRKIVEQWVWGYMHGPGKDSVAKPKNERLL